MKKGEAYSDLLLEVDRLAVTFYTPQGAVHAVREASFNVRRGEVLGLVGESGCGKSTVALAIMGYLPGHSHLGGGISFEGKNIDKMTPSELQSLRGKRIAMVYQDALSSLNPTMPVGPQVEEVLRTHLGMKKNAASRRVAELFDSVHLPEPERVGRRYPHELSGGMQQRVLIAMALACNPDLLLMDEPTTGLDVTTEATILDLVSELKQKVNAGIIWISHNLGVIARIADRVAVMYAGQIFEKAPVKVIFKNTCHPYTVGLLNCVPEPPTAAGARTKLASIPGSVYDPKKPTIDACLFAPRCPIAQPICDALTYKLFDGGDSHQSQCYFWRDVRPDLWGEAETQKIAPPREEAEPLLEVKGLRHFYGQAQRRLPFVGPVGQAPVRAIVDVDFDVEPGHTIGIVGESGSGKSTIARNVVGLLARTKGNLRLHGELLAKKVEHSTARQRAGIGIVFQNPASSLNPKLPIKHSLMRSLWKFAHLHGAQAQERTVALLESVGMNSSHMERLPSELSGGQQQRIALAAALAGNPDLIVADEPVSALDVSVQAQVLNLLQRKQQADGISYIFITHDLGVVRYVSDEILVIYAGHVAERGPAERTLKPPSHPYTEALLSSVPIPDPEAPASSIRLSGGVPSLREAFKGCFFAGRCPRKIGAICDTVPPPARVDPQSHHHIIVCHIPLYQLAEMQKRS